MFLLDLLQYISGIFSILFLSFFLSLFEIKINFWFSICNLNLGLLQFNLFNFSRLNNCLRVELICFVSLSHRICDMDNFGYSSHLVHLWFRNVQRTAVFLSWDFGAGNNWVGICNFAGKSFLVLAVDKAHTDAAINLHGFCLGSVEQSKVIPLQVHIGGLWFEKVTVLGEWRDANVAWCQHLNALRD